MTRAVIFDMDGVISDTQKLHAAAESEVLARYGIHVSPLEVTQRFAGVSYARMFTELFSQFGVAADLTAVIQDTRRTLWVHVETRGIFPVEGSRELILALREEGMKLAVASSSRRGFIDHVLTGLSLHDKFEAIASGEEVEQGKPEPDIFLLAAKRLGLAPTVCTVIEDGASGMIGARKAGMRCIGLVEHLDYEKYPADWLVKSLREVTPETVRNLMPQK